MIVLGVDPAITVTGYAIIDFKDNCSNVIDYGYIKTNPKVVFADRLKEIFENISEIIEKYQPNAYAIEDVIYAQNIKIALKMGQARGVALLAAVNNSIPIYEYSPREIKLAVTGNGAATKQQVQKMVVHLLTLNHTPTQYDITDAMAVAICHSNRKIKKIY